MNIRSFLCFLLVALCFSVRAEGYGNGKLPTGRTTVADPGEERYDVQHLRFDLRVTDTSVYVSGSVTTTAEVTEAMSSYVFELNSAMSIDSAEVNGVVLPVTHGTLVQSIALPTTLAAGTSFTAQVFYHGTAPSGSGFFNGLTHSVSSGGTQMLYSVSDPYAASDWWPCKQDVDDKIDSVDMYVTVPTGVRDGSNGLLVGTDTSLPGYSTYHWQTHYPIDYYLISIAVARYAVYESYMHFSGSSDSMLIQNFLMDTATFNPLYKANFDSIGMIVDYYSSLYGRYPFWKEKYGVCYTTLPGGMEHQTMTTIGVPETYIIAHELCHQWFGDHVTYSTWGDVWLSEGFATFSEQVFMEHFYRAAAALAHRKGYLNDVTSNPCGELYVTDTTSATTLFNEPTVYAKGQGVVTMLRYLAPTDSLFFQVLRNYQQTYAFGNASTANLKSIAEAVYGFSLDTFFNQWVYGKGYPEYKVSWNQVGSTVYVKVIQTTSCPASVALFSTPVELQLHSATGDTVIKVYNNADTTLYTFNWAPSMTNFYLNPDAWTLCKLASVVVHNTSLGIGGVLPRTIKILPNPSRNYWEVDQLPEGTLLALTDMNGRLQWHGVSNGRATVIPAAKLPVGDYLLRISNSSESESIQLSHW